MFQNIHHPPYSTLYNQPFAQTHRTTHTHLYRKSQITQQNKKNLCLPNITTNIDETQQQSKTQRILIKKDAQMTTFFKFLPRMNRTGLFHDQIKLSDFRQMHKIGQGSYSTVKLFLKKDKKYACKIFKKPLNGQILENVRNQISILKKIVHKNIIKLYYTFQDTNHLYIILEYIEGKTLSGFLKKVPTQNQIKSIFNQLVDAVSCLHSHSIVHRDIKLDNVMINDQNRVILIDFGFSTNSLKRLKMYCGTPSYMCPQIVRRGWYYGTKADIWALGVILYRMLTGKFPFKGANQLQVFGKICNCKLEELYNYSSQVNKLLKGLMNKNQKHRIDIQQVKQSKWLKQQENQTKLQK